MKKRLRVFVGMSGGVDSSVSAALLQKQGYAVTGVFIKTWSPEWLPCTWREERRDAMRVAAKLKIPLLTLDLEEEYKKGVAEYMIEGYRKGEVPNPDVMCNKVIKFGGFFDFAMKQGADFVATGHYAKTIRASLQTTDSLPLPARVNYLRSRSAGSFGDQAQPTSESLSSGNSDCFLLGTSADTDKDQTYFLWMLGQRQLSHTLFPIGDLKKAEVRKLAKKFDLPVAEKKDSQGLCFMGDIDVKDFLKHYIKEKPGKVLNEQGETMGRHEGATFYTIGERHGFIINKKTPDDAPYYVVSKDIEKNILIVSNKKNTGEILKKEIIIKDVNWNQKKDLELGTPSQKSQLGVPSSKLHARIRYRQELQTCRLEKLSTNEYRVIFDNGQVAPSSGQSIVFYSKNICLGGGVIV
jgi:tRNA-specific 2-thiouridylase